MTDDNQWFNPDADEHGFVNLEVLRDKALELGEDKFVQAYPRPGLLVTYRGDGEGLGNSPDQSGKVQLLTVAVRSAGILRYLSRVAFVAKRPGNPFAHLISVGRSNNNDVTIAVESVSKVHGYIVAEEELWRFTDHGSTNGSRLNGQVLDKGKKYTLQDGDVLQLGLEVMLEFLMPASLYQRARRGS